MQLGHIERCLGLSIKVKIGFSSQCSIVIRLMDHLAQGETIVHEERKFGRQCINCQPLSVY